MRSLNQTDTLTPVEEYSKRCIDNPMQNNVSAPVISPSKVDCINESLTNRRQQLKSNETINERLSWPFKYISHPLVSSLILVAFGLLFFFFWIVVFIRINAVNFNSSNNNNNNNNNIAIEAIDVWYAMASMTAWDAFIIVINFNRSLLHQWHFFVSLRIISIAFLVAYIYTIRTLMTVISMIVLYVVIVLTTRYLHCLLPPRGIRSGYGSLAEFSANMGSYEVPWPNAILYAAVNGFFGMGLVYFMPRSFGFLNPVIHITWEVTFLGWMKTRQTPRYIIFATPFVQAATAYNWGITQTMQSPRMTISPLVFIIFALFSRLMTDLHLYYCNREDFNWARKHVITSTPLLCIFFLITWIFEASNICLVYTSYFKVVFTWTMHAFGVLVFLIPAAYCLCYPEDEQIKLQHNIEMQSKRKIV